MLRPAQIAIEDPTWLSFLDRNRDSTIFHHPEWSSLLGNCYGYKPFVWVVKKEGGEIEAGVPLMEVNSSITGRRFVGLPFTDFCPPLARDDEGLARLTLQLVEWQQTQKGAPPVEIHWDLPDVTGVQKAGAYARHVTSLEAGPDEVYKRFKKKSVAATIVQATKMDMTVKRAESWNEMAFFYALHAETRRRLGTPVQPLKFFRLLWEKLITQGLGFLLLAYKDGRPIAGGVFLHWNKTLVYKYGASDEKSWNMRPNNLIIWQAMKWGCENGYEVFDWGRTDLDHEGLLSFKRHWGTEESIVHYSVISDKPPANRTSGRSRKILKTVIQHSPTWVCRAIGEALYKHFP